MQTSISTPPKSTLPMLSVNYRGPAWSATDRLAVATEVLGAVAFGPNSDLYRKLVIENHAVAGAILLGDLHGEKAIREAVEGHKDISAIKETMEVEGFDLSRVE